MLLIANDAMHYVRFDLYPLGYGHLGWHGFRIELGMLERAVVHAFAATESRPLFLDREVTPEIPLLCDALEGALAGEAMRFTNVDERDFELSVRPAPGGAILGVQATDDAWPIESAWVRGIEVTDAALRRFTAGLRLEFQQIMSAVPLVWRAFPGADR